MGQPSIKTKKQNNTAMNHADWQGSIQTFLSKKNANALESAVWVVEYCDFLKFAFVVGFLDRKSVV